MGTFKKVIGYILMAIGFLFLNILKFLLWISVCVLVGLAFIIAIENGLGAALLAAAITGVVSFLVALLIQWLAGLLGILLLASGAELVR